MTIIQEINDISSVVISLTNNTPSTEIKYVESTWTKKPKQYLKNLLNFSAKLNIFEIALVELVNITNIIPITKNPKDIPNIIISNL